MNKTLTRLHDHLLHVTAAIVIVLVVNLNADFLTHRYDRLLLNIGFALFGVTCLIKLYLYVNRTRSPKTPTK